MAGQDSITEAVGCRLRDVRRGRGLTMIEVAEASGGRWKTSSIGNYERGTRGIGLAALEWFAEFYGVPLSYLLEGRCAPEPRPTGPLTLNLKALAARSEAAPVLEIARQIAAWRRLPDPVSITMRESDLPVLAAALGLSVAATLPRLHQWNAV